MAIEIIMTEPLLREMLQYCYDRGYRDAQHDPSFEGSDGVVMVMTKDNAIPLDDAVAHRDQNHLYRPVDAASSTMRLFAANKRS